MESKSFSKSWGAERVASDEVRFRLWATGQQRVTLRLAGKDIEMTPQADGWFETEVAGVAANAEYDFVLADGTAVPDPAARAQKAEVNGPSLVIDPDALAGGDVYFERVETLVAAMLEDADVRLPGARRDALAQRAAREGIDVAPALYEQLTGLAAS